MQVVLLAGGLATRMRPLSETIPKSLFPLAGKTFLDHQLALLHKNGATKVTLLVGHLGAKIAAHLADHPSPVPVELIEDGPTLLGTGGAVAAVDKAGKLDATFILSYGDSYLQLDVAALARSHEDSGFPATMTVLDNHDRWDRSNCVVEGSIVTRYEKIAAGAERPANMTWIDWGMTVWSRTAIQGWRYEAPFDLKVPLMALSKEKRLGAFPVTERFYEIGSKTGLAELETLLTDRTGESR